jgi:hypothetical protein
VVCLAGSALLGGGSSLVFTVLVGKALQGESSASWKPG